MNIVETKYLLADAVKKDFDDGRKIYIYGCGVFGRHRLCFLREHGITASAFLVDDEYFSEGQFVDGLSVLRVGDICDTKEKTTIVMGFTDLFNKKFSFEDNEKINFIDYDIGIFLIDEQDNMGGGVFCRLFYAA